MYNNFKHWLLCNSMTIICEKITAEIMEMTIIITQWKTVLFGKQYFLITIFKIMSLVF